MEGLFGVTALYVNGGRGVVHTGKECLLLVMWYGRHGSGQHQQTML